MQKAKKYTKYQQELIDGVSSSQTRRSDHLRVSWRRILERARFLGDAEVETLAEETLVRLNQKPKKKAKPTLQKIEKNHKKGKQKEKSVSKQNKRKEESVPKKKKERVSKDRNAYTDKQLRIINGEQGPDELTGRTYLAILNKAKLRGDKAIAEFAQRELERCKNATRERNNARSRKRHKLINAKAEIEWKPPKTKEYSEHQKQIIRGEIAFETVHTNELVSICKRARACGDNELYERIYSLVIDRRQDAFLRRKQKKRASWGQNGRVHNLSQAELSQFDIDVLTGKCGVDNLRDADFEHILFLCEKAQDECLIELARTLLIRHKHPEWFYTCKTHEEAIGRIEQLMGLPIRRPETWFTPVQ